MRLKYYDESKWKEAIITFMLKNVSLVAYIFIKYR